jgi:general secretion pathway protein M
MSQEASSNASASALQAALQEAQPQSMPSHETGALAVPAAPLAGFEHLKAHWLLRWQALPAQQKQLAWVAGGALVVLLLWFVGLRPALQTLEQAPRQIEKQEAQLQSMAGMASQSRELRQVATVSPMQSAAALRGITERLGPKGQIMVSEDRATLTLNGIQAYELHSWLTEVRLAARAFPTEAELTRDGSGYRGTITLSIGANP